MMTTTNEALKMKRSETNRSGFSSTIYSEDNRVDEETSINPEFVQVEMPEDPGEPTDEIRIMQLEMEKKVLQQEVQHLEEEREMRVEATIAEAQSDAVYTITVCSSLTLILCLGMALTFYVLMTKWEELFGPTQFFTSDEFDWYMEDWVRRHRSQ